MLPISTGTIDRIKSIQKRIARKCIQVTLRFLILFFSSLLFYKANIFSQNLIPPIGQWREHLNYQQCIQVLKGDKIYCATNSNLFSIDSDNEAERYSKVTGLNDIGVQCIGWDASTQQAIVVYANSNVDVIKNSTIKNISDIKRSSVSGNKTVYSVYCKDGLAYLSTGLGIIVVNLSKYEIKDTWYIGANGGRIKVNAVTNDGTSFYTATEEGVKSIPANSSNLSNFINWQSLSGNNGLSAGSVKNILFCNNKITAEKNDSLFLFNGNTWSLLYTDKNWLIVSTTSSENKILVCQRTANGNARVIVLTTSGVIEKIISQSNVISLPKSAISDNGAVWVADQFGGLSKSGASVERFIPNGPPGSADGEMIVKDNILYAAAGSVNTAWNYQYNRNGIYYFQQDTWSSKSNLNLPKLDSVLDIITLAITNSLLIKFPSIVLNIVNAQPIVKTK